MEWIVRWMKLARLPTNWSILLQESLKRATARASIQPDSYFFDGLALLWFEYPEQRSVGFRLIDLIRDKR